MPASFNIRKLTNPTGKLALPCCLLEIDLKPAADEELDKGAKTLAESFHYSTFGVADSNAL